MPFERICQVKSIKAYSNNVGRRHMDMGMSFMCRGRRARRAVKTRYALAQTISRRPFPSPPQRFLLSNISHTTYSSTLSLLSKLTRLLSHDCCAGAIFLPPSPLSRASSVSSAAWLGSGFGSGPGLRLGPGPGPGPASKLRVEAEAQGEG